MGHCASSTEAVRRAARPHGPGKEREKRCQAWSIAAGGTAGHVVPALAVADALRAVEAPRSRFLGARRPRRGRARPGRRLRDRPPDAARPRSRPTRSAPPGRSGSPPRRSRRRAARLREREADAVLGGGGYVAAPAGPRGALGRAPAAGADRGRPPPRAHQPPARPPRPARLPRVPDRRARGRALPGHGPPRAGGGRARGPRRRAGAVRDRGRRSAACSSSAAARARGRSTSQRSTRSSATGPSRREFHVLHISGARDYPEAARPDRGGGPGRALHAGRVRARPRRRPRRLRPRAGARRWLDLRDRRRRAAGDPRPVPARVRTPPARERRVDGRRPGRRSCSRTPSSIRHGCARSPRPCSAILTASRRWPPPRGRSPAPTPRSGSPTSFLASIRQPSLIDERRRAGAAASSTSSRSAAPG